jgi:hypothetical protein
MTQFNDLLTGQAPPQIYTWSPGLTPEEFRSALARAGGRGFYCGGTAMGDGRGVMDTFTKELQFPDYFGANWDALEDCLTDLSWIAPQPSHYVLWLDRWDCCASPMLLEILNQTVNFWAEEVTPFYVLLSGGPGTVGVILTG